MDPNRPSGLDRRLRRAPGYVEREIAGETLLVPVLGDLAHLQRVLVLSEVAAFVWGRLDGQRDLADILADILQTFEVDADRARADLEAFAAELLAGGLAETVPPAASGSG